MKQALTTAIDNFLAERRESDGGWAEVRPEDLNQLSDIIQMLVEEKFEPDPDDDHPVGWKLVDRTKTRMPYFQPVPYNHGVETVEEFIANLKPAFDNLEIAVSEVGQDLSILKHLNFPKKGDQA